METLTFRQPRLVALALLVILAAGVSSLLAIGRQEDPTITNLYGTITTAFPGADPERVESLVTSDIEDMLRRIPEVDVIESVSATGVSVVTVELAATVPDDAIEGIWSEIRDDLSELTAEFPADVREPDFATDNGAFAAILALRAEDPQTPLTLVGRYAEDIAQELRNIPGTEKVELFGVPEEEVLVTLDPAKSAALGLSAQEVSRAVAAADSRGQAGRLRAEDADFLINVEGEVETLDRLREVILREGRDGSVTRLDQIANVTRGPREPASEIALVDGVPAVLVAARLESGRQVDVWASHVRDEMDAYRADLPQGLHLEQIFDQSTYTSERLTEVGFNMALGVALVVGVLLITLGLRAALIVALILPVVTLATLFTMKTIGLPIHQMSVTGLIVALGLLVDAAIVMTDEIGQRLAAGMTRLRAVSDAVRRLFAPLLASTVTTALSFTPLILLPGGAGDFVGAIAIAVVTMLCWSFIVAVTITPAIAGWFLPARVAPQPGSTGIGSLFARSIRWAVENPVKSVALSLVLPITGLMSLPTLTAQFFPGVDRDQFTIEVDMAPGSAISATRSTVNKIDSALRSDVRVSSVTWTIGRSAPPFYYNVLGNREDAPGHAHALITTASPEATESLLVELERDLGAMVPEAQVLVRGLVQGPPVAAPVEVRIVGDNLETLRELGDQARNVMSRVDAVSLARTTIGAGAPKISVTVDEAQAQRLGLDLGAIAAQLEAGLEGVTGGALMEGTEQIPVRVRLGGDLRADLDVIRDLPLLPPDAAQLSEQGHWPALPLSAIADVDIVPAPSSITRRNSERVNSVQGFVQRAVLPEEALAQVQAELDAEGFTLPHGYRLEIGGDSDARNDTLNDLFASLGLIVTLSIATIALTFNSFRLTGVALIVCLLAAGLSLFSLAVFRYPFGITAIIGVIGSIGVSINAAIIILTGLKEDAAARSGDLTAMAGVVARSARHIVSTTVTTFGGFLPLILAGGGFWPPFAMAVAGGVLLSTVVSFYFTPPMFALIYARRSKSQGTLELSGHERIYPLELRPAAE